MFSSFLLGGLGTLVKLAGAVLFLISLFVCFSNPGAGEFWIAVSIFVICFGAYCSYKSRHTVRIRG